MGYRTAVIIHESLRSSILTIMLQYRPLFFSFGRASRPGGENLTLRRGAMTTVLEMGTQQSAIEVMSPWKPGSQSSVFGTKARHQITRTVLMHLVSSLFSKKPANSYERIAGTRYLYGPNARSRRITIRDFLCPNEPVLGQAKQAPAQQDRTGGCRKKFVNDTAGSPFSSTLWC